jgi:cytochrome o ubiquinol oxidase subunit 2
MKNKFKIGIITVVLLAVIASIILFLNGQNVVVLNPKGMIGMKQRELIRDATLLMLIVVIPVLVLTCVFAWRYREKNTTAKYAPKWEHNYIAECLWWGIPLVIITILAIITWRSSHELDPHQPIDIGKKSLTIQAVALDWKWLFIYPEQGIATVNFVQFPAHTPITFEITSDAPMNSFWIPQLGGQIYAMSAMKTQLHLIANEEGQFRGCSANISGEGFAGMTFTAKASSQEDFDMWAQTAKQSTHHLGLEEYQQLAQPSQYNKVMVYALTQHDLFDWIVMKYITPPQHMQ